MFQIGNLLPASYDHSFKGHAENGSGTADYGR